MANTSVVWKEKMQFEGLSAAGEHSVAMDAKSPIGQDTGFTPKELVTLGMAGCTAMDVAALMKKYKLNMDSFEVKAEVLGLTQGHPTMFKEVKLTFDVKGAEVLPEKLIEAVTLSQTKYCGVNAMLSKACDVSYVVLLNDEEIAQGKAEFDI